MSSTSSPTPASDPQNPSKDQIASSSDVMEKQLLQVHEAFHRGDVQSARQLIDSINQESLSEDEHKQLQQFQSRLRFDSAELYLPIALFVFWALIFWNTVH